MPVDRPTFSESWYRVADLSPRLRSTVQVHRQHFRGQMWHVLQDPSNNQFFRLNEPAYRFVALLDGKRTVSQTWKICNEQFGDSAPTQGEVIQLLGQLYSSNLLMAEMPPDAEGLFNRYRKRVSREVRGYLMNLLYIRFPLLDPDRFLDMFVGIFGKLFTTAGFVIWAIIVCIGGYFAISHWDALFRQTEALLSHFNLAANLPLMYGSFIFIKAFHEFGHAFACKKFGLQNGSGGEVHVMGIMMLVFMPVPYVDASSSLAFRGKWQRAIVGAAGMIVELGIAAAAAVVWASTPEQSSLHALAYNVMFIGSISTLIFNGNPLLRYDGYFILSDLLEIPNLQQRSNDYLKYLVKKYVYGVRKPRNPAHTVGERVWFVFYGIASTVYRTVIVVGILLFISQALFELGILLAIASGVAWVVVPVWKFVSYLAANQELHRVRSRAVGTTTVFFAALALCLGVISFSEHVRADGVVEGRISDDVTVLTDGFVKSVLPTDRKVVAGKDVLVELENPDLEYLRERVRSELNELAAQVDVARQKASGDPNLTAFVGDVKERIRAKNREMAELEKRIDDLKIRPLHTARWISPELSSTTGAYLQRGQKVGKVVSADDPIIRVVVGQDIIAQLTEAVKQLGTLRAEIRVAGQPDLLWVADVTDDCILKSGSERLPSKALGYTAGGAIATDPEDREGTKAAEKVFEVRLTPRAENMGGMPDARLLSGQLVRVRFRLPDRPLGFQWYHQLRQVLNVSASS